MATCRVVPVFVCADAVKARDPPSTKDVSTAGVRLILPGKSGAPAFEPPPHPAMLHRERIATAKRRPPERNLPMHPLCPRATVLSSMSADKLSNELENL